MKKQSTKADDLHIPVLKPEQLGTGVRGKYLKQFQQGSNVVIVRPELLKAFPTSAAVNDALASYLAFAREARNLTRQPIGRGLKRKAA